MKNATDLLSRLGFQKQKKKFIYGIKQDNEYFSLSIELADDVIYSIWKALKMIN